VGGLLPIPSFVASGTFGPEFDAHDSALLQRIAGTVAIMLYEMELRPDASFECLAFVGLETFIGPVAEGVSPEDAYDSAVHPDDREVYDAALNGSELWKGEPLEIEYRLFGSDGEVRWVLDRMQPERRLEDGSLLVSGVVADISKRKRVEAEAMEKLAYAAQHDPLTGLANRASLLEHLQLALRRASRSGAGVAVLFCDLDNFKLVNDSFGHAAGDELLKTVGERLQAEVRGIDVVSRQGGDEFLVLLSDLDCRAGAGGCSLPVAEVVADRVCAMLREPFLIEGTEIHVSASIGVSLYPTDADDAATLLKHADLAMYSVKDAGRDGYALYRRGQGRDRKVA
jgi:diguanylate cyclase (GGDEF)-like protein/PAS domain S-box-containing protein